MRPQRCTAHGAGSNHTTMSAYDSSAVACGLPPGRKPFRASGAATRFALALASGSVSRHREQADAKAYAADAIADSCDPATASLAVRTRGES